MLVKQIGHFADHVVIDVTVAGECLGAFLVFACCETEEESRVFLAFEVPDVLALADAGLLVELSFKVVYHQEITNV